MTAIVEGVLMEEYKKKDRDGNEVNVVRLFQKGEKKLLEVKEVPEGIFTEGELCQMKVKIFPWANDRGLADISCTFLEV